MRHQTRQSVSALLAVTAVLGLPAANALAVTSASSPTAKQKAAAAKAAAAKKVAAAKQAAAQKAAAAKAAAAKKAAATATVSTGPKTYVGSTVDMHWGPVTVTITVENGKVTSASADLPLEKARSEYINSRVGPYLNAQTVQIQSAQVDLIGGATQTCDAYAQSLQSALDKANSKSTTSTAGA